MALDPSSGLYTDANLICQRKTQAQKTWVAFKTYWTDTLQEHEDINKLTAENAGLGENSAMESETHDKKLDAAMENLVAMMSSDKSQVGMLLATNTLLSKQLTKNYVTITRSTKELSPVVNIITKISGKITPLTTTTTIAMQEKYHLTGRGQIIQTIPHSIQMDTAGHTDIAYISITAV